MIGSRQDIKTAASGAAKALLLVALALSAGVGVVYATTPTLLVATAIFVVGLWTFGRDIRPSYARPKKASADTKRNQSKPRGTLAAKLVSAYLFVWWLVLVAPVSLYAPRGGGDPTQGAAQGSLRNQALIVSFGLVGALFLPAALKRFDPAFRWVAGLWALYLCWAFASLSWSVYPPLTFRNVLAFGLVTVGSFGLGAGFYGSLPNGRDLFLRHVFAAGVLSALAVLAPLPFNYGQYDLLNPAQRLAIGGDFPTYVVRPVICALLALVATAILRVRKWQGRDWLWVVVLMLPLLALKARGPILWAVLALAIFYLFYRVQVRDRIMQAGLLFVIGFGTYAYYSGGIFAWLVPYLTRGSVEYTMTLSNRIPLWNALLPEVGRHPWTGVGFAAYWNPDNLGRTEQLVGFLVVSAHNGFLEELLNTGVVGLVILMAFFLCAATVVVRRGRGGDPLGWLAFLFLIFYLLLNLTNALIQEFQELPFTIFLAMLALMASRPAAGPPAARSMPDVARRRVASPR